MSVKDPERAGRRERKRRRMKAGFRALQQVFVGVSNIPSLSSILRERGAGERGRVGESGAEGGRASVRASDSACTY
jgi:hypothetical protein